MGNNRLMGGVLVVRKKLPLRYNADSDRWFIEDDGWTYELHCGDSFELYIGGKPIPCRLEMDKDWYVMMQDVSFNLRKKATYFIQM